MEITAVFVAQNGAETKASVAGEVITVNGVDYDLSSIPERGMAQPTGDHPFLGPIRRVDGVLRLWVLWLYDPTTAEPHQGVEHPVLTVTSGDVPDPVKRRPPPEEIDEKFGETEDEL